MKLGILQFELCIDGSKSLKDKRSVVKSLKDRLHREHMVSVAEVGAQEVWNMALLGLVCVSSDGGYLHGVLDNIVRKLQSLPEARLVDFRKDVLDSDQLAAGVADEDGRPLWTPSERRDGGDRPEKSNP